MFQVGDIVQCARERDMKLKVVAVQPDMFGSSSGYQCAPIMHMYDGRAPHRRTQSVRWFHETDLETLG